MDRHGKSGPRMESNAKLALVYVRSCKWFTTSGNWFDHCPCYSPYEHAVMPVNYFLKLFKIFA
jgi:hypothetical protein